MFTMYSKLFTAGLGSTSSDEHDTPSSITPPTAMPKRRPRSTTATSTSSSSQKPYSTRPSHISQPSTSSLFSPGSIEIVSPQSSFPATTGNEIFFTFRPKIRPTSSTKPSKRVYSINDENDLRSFLSLDLAESMRSKRYKSSLVRRRMSSVDEGASMKSFIAPAPRRRFSSQLPKAKPVPSAALPPLKAFAAVDTITVKTPQPTAFAFDLSRSSSIMSTASPSVLRANRNNALAALEGRHINSFWDEDDEHESPETFAPSSFSSYSSIASTPVLETPPANPLRAVDVNIPPVPLDNDAIKRRNRSSTIESWFVPSLNISDHLDELDQELEHGDYEERDIWKRLVVLS